MLSTLHTLSHLLLPPVTLSSRYYHSLHFTRKETEVKFNPWLLATQLTNDRTRMGTHSLQASRAPAIPRSSAPACVCLLTKKGCNSKEEAFLAGLCSGPFSRAGETLDHIIFSSGSQLTSLQLSISPRSGITPTRLQFKGKQPCHPPRCFLGQEASWEPRKYKGKIKWGLPTPSIRVLPTVPPPLGAVSHPKAGRRSFIMWI